MVKEAIPQTATAILFMCLAAFSAWYHMLFPAVLFGASSVLMILTATLRAYRAGLEWARDQLRRIPL